MTSDFLNIDMLAEAVASKIKIEGPELKRAFGPKSAPRQPQIIQPADTTARSASL